MKSVRLLILAVLQLSLLSAFNISEELAYAEYLAEKGRSYEAHKQYQRCMFFAKDESKKKQILVVSLNNLLKREDGHAALTYYQENKKLFTSDNTYREEFDLMGARALLISRDYMGAWQLSDLINRESQKPENQDQALLISAAAIIRGLMPATVETGSDLRLAGPVRSGSDFMSGRQIKLLGSDLKKGLSTLSGRAGNPGLNDEYEAFLSGIPDGVRLRRKSPFLAFLFSLVLPGSGQLYAGYPGSATRSFFLNSIGITGGILTIYLEVKEMDGDIHGWTIPAMLVSGLLYFTNLNSAANLARKKNKRIVYDLRLGLLKELQKVSLKIGYKL